MATKVKELIEILQKYQDPEEYVCWNYYTVDEFPEVEGLTQEIFLKAIERFERADGWEHTSFDIQEAIWQVMNNEDGEDNA